MLMDIPNTMAVCHGGKLLPGSIRHSKQIKRFRPTMNVFT